MSEGEVAIKALGWSQFFFAMKAGAALCIFLTGLFGSAVAFTPLVAQHFHERAQKRELAAEGLTRTIWLEPEKKLRKTFSKRELTGDLVLFERVASDTGSVSLVEAILKRGTKTVAVAEVLALDAKDSWSFGSATEMSDNAPTPETYSLSEAMSQSTSLR